MVVSKPIVSPEIYYIISKDFEGSINAIYNIGNNVYEVNYGIHSCSAYYHIINGMIVGTQFD